MAKTPTPNIVRVHLWGREVGALTDYAGKITFAYHPDYVKAGLPSISPMHLPVTARPFSQAPTRDVFEGLMGVFADSLPDLYGKKLIQTYFRSKYGDPKYKPGSLHTLMYIGSRGLGALEYLPADQMTVEAREALEMAEMVAFAKRVIEGNLEIETDAKAVITSIMQSGSLAGGARPKAIVGWDRGNNSIIAGVPPLPAGYEHWLIKFDGMRDAPEDWGRVEFVYSQIARSCGIEMSETHLLRESGRAHFMTKRFDIDDQGNRLHMHSLSGLMHSDFNLQRDLDYSTFFDAVRFVTKSEAEVRKAFQRLAFNYVGRNCDDHTKNFAFLMDKQGQWRLSPQYDLCYSYGEDERSWVHQHQMTVLGKADFSRKDLVSLGDRYDVRDPEGIIQATEDAFAHWPELARQAGVNESFAKHIYNNLHLPTHPYVWSNDVVDLAPDEHLSQPPQP